jgi:hypothetical protein
MKLRFLLILLIFLSYQGIQAATPVIEGAFGLKLGDTPRSEYQKGDVYTKVGTLYFIDPPIKNMHFNEYAILVTKTTNKIHSIYAEKEQKTVSCEEEILKVKESLLKHYSTISEKDHIYFVKIGDREINLTCKVNKKNANNASLQIKYIDHKIYEEGRVKSSPEKRDASGL